MHRHDNLQIWKKSTELCLLIYKQTKDFPEEEKFCLVNQLRRSSISVPSNIAEESRRTSTKDFKHFLLIASGSLTEIDIQLFLAKELQYLQECDYTQSKTLTAEISKMLHSFYKKDRIAIL
ncbi:MAG: hypothetical protein RLZZ308_540 [Candidatus Parcubacteria bacterium]|jgi:four helix bundle protein